MNPFVTVEVGVDHVATVGNVLAETCRKPGGKVESLWPKFACKRLPNELVKNDRASVFFPFAVRSAVVFRPDALYVCVNMGADEKICGVVGVTDGVPALSIFTGLC